MVLLHEKWGQRFFFLSWPAQSECFASTTALAWNKNKIKAYILLSTRRTELLCTLPLNTRGNPRRGATRTDLWGASDFIDSEAHRTRIATNSCIQDDAFVGTYLSCNSTKWGFPSCSVSFQRETEQNRVCLLSLKPVATLTLMITHLTKLLLKTSFEKLLL